jgi:BON domain
MPKDFENAINTDQLDDDEVRDLVRQQLEEADDFDADDVEISVREGRVLIEGRVGTDEERQHVEQVLTALGVNDYQNDVVVDEAARAEYSEAADVARLEDAAVDDELGERGRTTSDTAEHLRQDTAGEQFGTRDLKKAVEQGQSYNPPDGPMQEGIEGGPQGERH